MGQCQNLPKNDDLAAPRHLRVHQVSSRYNPRACLVSTAIHASVSNVAKLRFEAIGNEGTESSLQKFKLAQMRRVTLAKRLLSTLYHERIILIVLRD